MIAEVLTLLILVLAITYHVSKRKFDYWKKRKIPYLKPVPFLGNYGPYIIQKKYIGQTAAELCEKFPDTPYFGAFYGTEPTLIVKDPEMVKKVMTKDYYYFNSREISNYTHKEVITQNLFFTYGDRWKVLRQNLTPIFSSAKMKNMFYLIDKSAHVFEGMLDRELKMNDVQAVRTLISRYTMDSIGSCVFGVDTETMTEDPSKNPFFQVGSLIFAESYLRSLMTVSRAIWPAVFYGLNMKSFPKEMNDFFDKLMKGVFEQRQYKPTNRNDFVDLILNWQKGHYITGDSMQNMKGNEKKVKLEVDDELLVGQSILLFGAGYETSATTLQYTLYELAKNQEAQAKVHTEIDEYLLRHNNALVYECVTELPYTEACVDEALRMYPVLGVLTREVVEEYTLPCGAVIEKGVRVHVRSRSYLQS
ncbi:cytochrome P450 6B2 isoform X2 [Amyelois transitella]|uniref:cytochrome P450 6B2 isoform X2 n=1 Tax=Amyelois transitella TaxID=680683 RepID=UPI002990489E|nr:cytochrome P450 6B2 isoform X2 [Amyelois transitella]